jgi:uncharacterized protein YegP (UPF0339 family)
MKFEIEKAKDGTFTTRLKSGNGKIIAHNKQVDTKQAAYKNVVANIKAYAKLLRLKPHIVRPYYKTKDVYCVFVIDEEIMHITNVPVKEINC